jgi:hypothetical protein
MNCNYLNHRLRRLMRPLFGRQLLAPVIVAGLGGSTNAALAVSKSLATDISPSTLQDGIATSSSRNRKIAVLGDPAPAY